MSKAVKYYLGAYNGIAFLAWAAYLVCFLAAGFQLDAPSLYLLNIAQGLAFLEIVHALLKWVKSPVLSTAAQVASRLLVLVLIVSVYP
jgi:very-long-chain (3R)-3-hydroxyacyl-CoA dehydratase